MDTTILGLVVLILLVTDVLQTILVPRGKALNFRIATVLVRHILWPVCHWLAKNVKSPVWKAQLLGLFAPTTLLVLLSIWIFLLILGFGIILLGFSDDVSPKIESFWGALYVAGTSVLTLGYGDYIGKTATVRLIMLGAAFAGVIITASVVSMIFTLIGAVHRREVLITMTSNIAGAPPSGIAILETYSSLKGRQSLNSFYDEWQKWCADVLESHKAYPLLPYFNSTDTHSSWLTSLGAVLDSAALLISSEPDGDLCSAQLFFRLGTRLVRDLTENWQLGECSAQGIGDEALNTLWLRIKDLDSSVADESVFKQRFEQLRQKYCSALEVLCSYMAVPQTPLLTEQKVS